MTEVPVGRPKPPVSKPGRGVPVGPVRAHLRRKIRQGATSTWLAEQAGVSHKTVLTVLNHPRRSVYRGTAEALLAVTAPPPPVLRSVDPGPTIAKIDDLAAAHWRVTDIARAAGLSPSTLRPSNLTTGVSAQTAAAVDQVWVAHQGALGSAPRTYPWLTEQVRAHPISAVVMGAGISRSSVQRLRAGMPVSRDVARRTSVWLSRMKAEQMRQQGAMAA